MSDTPWTDERERVGKIRSSSALMGVVPAVYVRELETELAETRAEIERKDKLIEQMREALKSAIVVVGFYEANTGAGKGIGQMVEAAIKAERGG